MTAKILDGTKLATKLLSSLQDKVSKLKSLHSLTPTLAIVQVGDNYASNIYIGNKIKKCREINIAHQLFKFPQEVSEKQITNQITDLNNNDDIHGIIVQMPLPKQLNINNIISLIDPSKDVDGFHPLNVGKLLSGQNALVPCTPQGCLLLIKTFAKNLAGKKAVIIGRSNIVGKPMSYLLLNENCTVTIAHSYTQNLATECSQADIIIAAIGKSQFITEDYIKRGAIVIDVGINHEILSGTSKIVGDVDFKNVSKKAAAISPVPGGVGPMTVACLLKNTVSAACIKQGILFNNI
jgi:methylenetetrahydrofolate dehydrogenase (NADP+)/methenyltetrahydrofolate cyclohydrolase